jgi:deuterolysin
MISNILPIVVLAGAAMAVCPFPVEIAGTTGHVAQIAVTNNGNETLTVFKGNTVLLSDHDTKDLLVADAGMLGLLS